jgi:hypothetical protein
MKSQQVVFYGLTLAGLVGTGALMLAWHLTPPNPDRVGYWYIVIFLGWPFLGLMGLLALALRPRPPLRVGVSLLAYSIVSFALMLLLAIQPLASLLEPLLVAFPRGFEGLQLLLLTLILAVVISSVRSVRHR